MEINNVVGQNVGQNAVEQVGQDVVGQGVIEQNGVTFGAWINSFGTAVAEKVNEQWIAYTAEGTLIDNTSQTIAGHSSSFKYFGAALGGTVAINSAMNLLQERQNIQPTREFTKIVVGTGLVALCLYASNEDELSGSGIAALGAGLATALLKVATHVKETFHIHLFKLKNRDSVPGLQDAQLMKV